MGWWWILIKAGIRSEFRQRDQNIMFVGSCGVSQQRRFSFISKVWVYSNSTTSIFTVPFRLKNVHKCLCRKRFNHQLRPQWDTLPWEHTVVPKGTKQAINGAKCRRLATRVFIGNHRKWIVYTCNHWHKPVCRAINQNLDWFHSPRIVTLSFTGFYLRKLAIRHITDVHWCTLA
jgi:hypothetical protein